MTKPKNTAALARPVTPARWTQIKQSERMSYGTAQPLHMSWKSSEHYTCPELNHRSTKNQPPSLVLGQRVNR